MQYVPGMWAGSDGPMCGMPGVGQGEQGGERPSVAEGDTGKEGGR